MSSVACSIAAPVMTMFCVCDTSYLFCNSVMTTYYYCTNVLLYLHCCRAIILSCVLPCNSCSLSDDCSRL